MFRFCKKVLLIDSVAFGITGTLWLGGQRTADRLGSILLILGAIVAAIGAFIGEGARGGSVDYTYFRARSVGTANHDERTRQEWDYKEHSDYVGGILAVAGGGPPWGWSHPSLVLRPMTDKNRRTVNSISKCTTQSLAVYLPGRPVGVSSRPGSTPADQAKPDVGPIPAALRIQRI